ncbi:hypothetical protein NLM33_44870 [Bradyrhizobium sp. CCGUVB1N3]|uniref:hypothetical protein n=1 Tax=Bradyrhizobium sp. CCGUVB1N3 TaxID=2949629 RepID=UPI0020B3E8EE|nr:hypothetical protein [Bradyrhizobium sp. CCGUVB1N3]MCP3477295.1 hypothetical protein [Bradyrhizobium sp. CCGUVB1N3]
MKVFRMAALLAVIAGPAYAQNAMPHINMLQDGPSKTDEEKAADAERDQRYKETLRKIPDAKAPNNDPWGGMRADPPKTAAPKASAAAKKTKTAPTAN